MKYRAHWVSVDPIDRTVLVEIVFDVRPHPYYTRIIPARGPTFRQAVDNGLAEVAARSLGLE